jgi:hypothetical protein
MLVRITGFSTYAASYPDMDAEFLCYSRRHALRSGDPSHPT